MHRYFVFLSLIFCTLLTFGQSTNSKLKMKVWRNGSSTAYTLSEVDSVTFSNDTLDQPETNITIEDNFYSSEENLKQALNGVYAKFVNFYQCEKQLEYYALGLDTYNNIISPESSLISSCWANGYSLVAFCNNTIQGIKGLNNFSFNPDKYMYHFLCIRDLTLYMMTQLWGDIPAPDHVVDVAENIYEDNRLNIIQRAYSTFDSYRMYMTDTNEYYLNSQNMLPLMREMEIELCVPYKYNYTEVNTTFHLWVDGNDSGINVVDEKSWSMLMQEKNTETDIDAFAQELLASCGKRYGVWRAMVRIGKATPHNGMSACLYFPKPKTELMANPNEHQNEGYSN